MRPRTTILPRADACDELPTRTCRVCGRWILLQVNPSGVCTDCTRDAKDKKAKRA